MVVGCRSHSVRWNVIHCKANDAANTGTRELPRCQQEGGGGGGRWDRAHHPGEVKDARVEELQPENATVSKFASAYSSLKYTKRSVEIRHASYD